MTISNELESIADFIKAIFPEDRVERQNVPDTQVPNLFVVRFIQEVREVETGSTDKITKQWELFYFGNNTIEVLDKMGSLSFKMRDKKISIPIKDSLRYMKVQDFVIEEPFRDSENLDGITATFSTETREARSQETFQKIMNVSVIIN